MIRLSASQSPSQNNWPLFYWPLFYWPLFYWPLFYWPPFYWPPFYWPPFYWPPFYWPLFYWPPFFGGRSPTPWRPPESALPDYRSRRTTPMTTPRIVALST